MAGRLIIFDVATQLIAIHPRDPHVADHRVRMFRTHNRPSIDTIIGRIHLLEGLAQHLLHETCDALLVVHHQEGIRQAGSGIRRRQAGQGSTFIVHIGKHGLRFLLTITLLLRRQIRLLHGQEEVVGSSFGLVIESTDHAPMLLDQHL